MARASFEMFFQGAHRLSIMSFAPGWPWSCPEALSLSQRIARIKWGWDGATMELAEETGGR